MKESFRDRMMRKILEARIRICKQIITGKEEETDGV